MGDEYSGIAPCYDFLLSPFLGPIQKQVALFLQDRGCGLVLDMCCGTGALARSLARHGMRTVGLDLSTAMLDKARTHAGDRTFFALADASLPPVRRGAFDAVVVSMALHEMEDDVRRKTFHNMLCIAPLIVVIDYAAPVWDTGANLLTRLARLTCHIPERLAGARHYRSYRRFMAEGGIEGFLAGNDGIPTFRKDFLFATLRMLALENHDDTCRTDGRLS